MDAGATTPDEITAFALEYSSKRIRESSSDSSVRPPPKRTKTQFLEDQLRTTRPVVQIPAMSKPVTVVGAPTTQFVPDIPKVQATQESYSRY